MRGDTSWYRSQQNREPERLSGKSAQFPGLAVSASTGDKETKMLLQGKAT
jgi:hypothetical protein